MTEEKEAKPPFKISIRPPEVEVDSDDPFKHDLLNRKSDAKALTSIIQNIGGPCVISINAPWGAGKTAFVNMWACSLTKKKYQVLKFNVWETDYSNNPFVALSSELLSIEGKGTVSGLKEKANKIAPILANQIIKYIVGVDINVNEIVECIREDPDDAVKEYLNTKKNIKEFKKALSDFAKAQSEKTSAETQIGDNTKTQTNNGKPLIFIIDELDRCRPPYAIAFLEIVKHLFSVDNIIFVLSLHKEQLEFSLKSLYGNDFDAERYLRRFIDLNYKLNDNDREELIKITLQNSSGLQKYISETLDEKVTDIPQLIDIYNSFFCTSKVSVRDILQAIKHLEKIYTSYSIKHYSHILWVSYLLILRTIDPVLYFKFINGNAFDKEVVEVILSNPEYTEKKKHRPYSYCYADFAGEIIKASRALAGQSKLWEEYKSIVEKNETSDQEKLLLAKLVIRKVENYKTEQEEHTDQPPIHEAIKIIEMASTSFTFSDE